MLVERAGIFHISPRDAALVRVRGFDAFPLVPNRLSVDETTRSSIRLNVFRGTFRGLHSAGLRSALNFFRPVASWPSSFSFHFRIFPSFHYSQLTQLYIIITQFPRLRYSRGSPVVYILKYNETFHVPFFFLLLSFLLFPSLPYVDPCPRVLRLCAVGNLPKGRRGILRETSETRERDRKRYELSPWRRTDAKCNVKR